MSCASGTSYIVQAGDILFTIAKRQLGDGNRWPEIKNPDGTSPAPKQLQPGQELCLPGASKNMSRNVIYFSSNANSIPLAGISKLSYTDIIIGFLVPDSNFNLVGEGGAFDNNLQSNVQTLQRAGKNVLISFGGAAGWPTSAWKHYSQNVNGLVNQIVKFVNSYGFNGVDIDYEDDAGFMGTYDGIGFLSALTSELAQALPSGQNIITHAPSPPFWAPNWNNAPYVEIWKRVGHQITWINNQFYDNKDYDHDATTKVLWYQNIAAIIGAPKLLMGAILSPKDGDEGYITLDDVIQNVITPLQSTFGSQFGGFMGWEFAYDQGGAWATGIGQALNRTLTCPGKSYTLVKGDTLHDIAQKFLGDGNLWMDLKKPDGTPFTEYEAGHLNIGQVVCIPGRSAGSKPLDLLRSISGTRTVAGEHNREPLSDPAKWTEAIHSTTGKYPGFWSSDFLFEQDNIDSRQTMIDEAKRQWNQGAIVHLMYHACPPTQSEACKFDGGVKSRLSDDQWNELITDGTNLNNVWKSRLDRIAVFLQDLKDHGVEVLWRPLHEMNQGVFWWGGRPGPNGTRKLYQITHDYLVKIKGLTNLIWVWDVQDFPNLSQDLSDYNPGDSYWDIAALDIYRSDGQGYTKDKYDAMIAVAGGKPIAIGECDVLPKASELAAQPRWAFFMVWAELVYQSNSEQEIRDLYNAANILTRDELPGWGR